MGVFKKIKFLALTLSVSNWVLAPLAQAAANTANRERLNVFLKTAGLAGQEKITVGEFYYRFRNWYPKDVRGYLDTWVSVHKDDPMPTADVQVIKDQLGESQYRIHLAFAGGGTVNLTTGNDHIRLNNYKFGLTEYSKPKDFLAKVFNEEPSLKKTYGGKVGYPFIGAGRLAPNKTEYTRINRAQQMAYFLKVRSALEAAEKVHKLLGEDGAKGASFEFESKYDVIARWMAGLPAFAVKQGESCIVGGWVTTYGNGLSCGADKPTGNGKINYVEDLRAQAEKAKSLFTERSKSNCGTNFSCNPMVYGFNSDGGSFCAPRSNIIRATEECNRLSPKETMEDRKKIVQSWAKAMGKKGTGENGELKFQDGGCEGADPKQPCLAPEDYEMMKPMQEKLTSFIDDARNQCYGRDVEKGSVPPKTKQYKAKRKDQQLACDDLYNRAFDLEAFFVKQEPPVQEECPEPGMVRTPAGTCECKPECRSDGGHCGPIVKPEPVEPPIANDPPEETPVPRKQVKKDDNTCWWLIGGLLVGGGLLAWWLLRDKDKKVPPVTTTPLPPPNLPPVPPPPANPIDPTQNAEGGTNPAPINGGGVGR